MKRAITSDNVSGADNQQERLAYGQWIVGFTDGEGCFTISIIKNKTTRFGIQIFPEFVITQGAKSILALKKIQKFFKCGSIVLNKRYDNHNEHLYRYCVRSVTELSTVIIPFFSKNKLQTNKKNDFLIFKKVVSLMVRKKHLAEKGKEKILVLASRMNRKKKRI